MLDIFHSLRGKRFSLVGVTRIQYGYYHMQCELNLNELVLFLETNMVGVEPFFLLILHMQAQWNAILIMWCYLESGTVSLNGR